MRIAPLVLAVSLALTGCGENVEREIWGAYVVGNPSVAQFKAEYFEARSRGHHYVNGQLIRSDLIEPLLEQTDAVLNLKRNGYFTYYGPPRRGEDERALTGTWRFEDGAVHLDVTSAVPAHDLFKSTIVCPYRPGVVSYPASPDAERTVYFDLAFDGELAKVPTGLGRVRTTESR